MLPQSLVRSSPELAQGGSYPPWWRDPSVLSVAGILLVSAGLRLWEIDRTSLWYDEVVTMRVARSGSVPELLATLNQIDGTRAPLHPLLLQNWLRLFGPSGFAGRSASALCGVLTVGLVFLLGRQTFDATTGRWAAWLAAVCPPLVYYSQEARMYAWLVMLTCLSWLVFFSFRNIGVTGSVRCLLAALVVTRLQSSAGPLHGGGTRPVVSVRTASFDIKAKMVVTHPDRRDSDHRPLASKVSGSRHRLSDASLFDSLPSGRAP